MSVCLPSLPSDDERTFLPALPSVSWVSTTAPAPSPPNLFTGKVTDLAPTRSGLEVRLDARGLNLVAHVSRRHVAALGLELGMTVYASLRDGMGDVIRE